MSSAVPTSPVRAPPDGERRRLGAVLLRVLIAAAIGSAVVLGAASLHSGRADRAVFLAFNRWQLLPDALWATLGVAGYGVSSLAIAAIVARRSPRIIASLLWFAAVSGAATHVVKRAFPTPRPRFVLGPNAFHVIGDELFRRSMPSGHTVAATGVALVVCLAGGPAWRRPWVVASAALLAIGVGLSRIACGAHWPTDVVAGAAVGCASAAISVELARWSRLDIALSSSVGSWLIALVQIGAGIAVITLDTDGLDGRVLQVVLVALAIGMGVQGIAHLVRTSLSARAAAAKAEGVRQ